MVTRLIEKIEEGRYSAKVYYDAYTHEYMVRFFAGGKWVTEADYFTDDKDDAIGSAKAEIKLQNMIR